MTWAQGLLLSHILQNKLSLLAFKEITALELDHLYQLAQVAGWFELSDLVLLDEKEEGYYFPGKTF